VATEQNQRHAVFLLPTSQLWNPKQGLGLEAVGVPSPDATLGHVGLAAQIVGPAHFNATILVQCIPGHALTGIEPSTLRVFRFEAEDWSLVRESGFNIDLGQAWARIVEPGIYVPIGLPRDPLLRELLQDLASYRRSASSSVSRLQAQVVTHRRLQAALDETSPAALDELRELIAAADFASTTDPLSLRDFRRGKGGAVQPLPLPNGATLEQFRERARSVRTPDHGLPEEALFSDSSIAMSPASMVPTFGELPPALARQVQATRLDELAVQRARAGLARAAIGAVPPSANWWMYHRDPLHSGVVTDSHISRRSVGGLKLRARLDLGGPVVSVPAVVDNAIYVGIGNSRWAPLGSGGTLFKVDLVSGAVLRTFTFHTPRNQGSRQGMAGIACTPAVVHGRVYFSGLDGRVYCLDATTFALIWSTNLRRADPARNQPVTHAVAAEGWSSPLVISGRVYVGFGESESNTFGFVYCLDALTGDVVWLFCTTVFPGMTENEPNVIPESVVGMALPPGFRAHTDPLQRGASPWSSFAFDPVSNRVVVGTGNVLPQHALPQPRYSLGVLSLDATTGRAPRFFQPSSADNYRPDDTDVDVAAAPMLFVRDNRRVVAIGSKNGSFFLLDADTLAPLARRQLLPRAGGNGGFPGDTGAALPEVDPHRPAPGGEEQTENFYGVFSTASYHGGLKRLFVGVGGFAFGVGNPGIDSDSTAFLRCLNWDDLTDAWVTSTGPDGVERYVAPRPPMYSAPGEAGFASPAVVNDVVFMATSRPGLYAFDVETGLPLWGASGMGPPIPNSFTLGPVVYGDYVVAGSANVGLLIYSL